MFPQRYDAFPNNRALQFGARQWYCRVGRMNRIAPILPTVCLLLVAGSSPAAHEEKLPDAESLVSRVAAKYRAASAYESTGTATIHVLRPADGTETTSEVQFGILMARPQYYRIAWTQQTASGSAVVGAIWNSGDGPKLYDSSRGGYSRLASDELAFSVPTGTSLGVSQMLPDLFFGTTGGKLRQLRDLAVEGEDVQQKIPCYAVAGRLKSGVDYHLWIATNNLNIVRMESSLGGERANQAVPDATPERKRELLRAMGKEETEENLAYINDALEKARGLIRNIRGTSRQFYRGVRTAFITVPQDFEYAMPDGSIELTGELSTNAGGNDTTP